MIFMPQFKVGSRVSITGEICTVLFVGIIDAWPDELAYGVEWDNADRGRHSGTSGSTQYFSTRVPNAGSFLKAKKVDTIFDNPRSLYGAINERYQRQTELVEVDIGEKKVEQLGFEKLDLINMKWFNLPSISLSSYCINVVETRVETDPIKVKDLNISRNLFNDFNEILLILEQFTDLRSLNLAGNRFYRFSEKDVTFTQLETLCLANCFLRMSEVNIILRYFPNLKELDLGNNFLLDSDISFLELPKSLISLNVAGNDVTEIVPTMDKLRSLNHLNISNTKCTDIFETTKVYPSTTSLELNGLTFSRWDYLNSLNLTFPNLLQFRCDLEKLPSEGLKANISYFDLLVACFDNLTVLNGSLINSKARQDSELYFIAKVLENDVKFNKDLSRWKNLMYKYDIKEMKRSRETNWLISDVITISIKIIYTESVPDFKLQLYTGSSVRYVKGSIAAKLKVPVYQIDMTYETPTGNFKNLPREFSSIGDFGVEPEGTIHIDLKKPQ